MSHANPAGRGWPAGLVGALALVAAFEAMVAAHALDFTTPARLEWRESHKAATERAPGYAVLNLGTSMSKLGLFPAMVERESGRRTFNLSFCAGRIPASYYLLKHALEAGAKPEAVLLEVHPTYIGVPYNDGVVSWPDVLDPADALDMAIEARDPAFFLSTMVAKALPSINARAEVRAATVAGFNGVSTYNRQANEPLVRNLARNDGAFVHRNVVAYDGQISPLLANIYLTPTTSVDPLNERYLRRTIELCNRNKIRVFWMIPPFIPVLQIVREQIGHDRAYTALTRRFQKKYPDLVVLDARHAGYPPATFFDAAHLDYIGAVPFSGDVGRAIKSSLAPGAHAPRWVDLPTYHLDAPDLRLEEIAQSARAIEEGKLRR